MAAADGGMYRREKAVALRGSCSALYNNLSVLPRRPQALAYFAAVRGGTVHLVSAAADGLSASHRQLQAKEGGLPGSASVLTQMYESDGSIMVYWHALDAVDPPPAQAVFARGIAAAGGRFVCVGTSSGLVLVFDVPGKGTNITLSEVLEEHCEAITDIAAELSDSPAGAADLVTADDVGTLCVWRAGEAFALLTRIPAFGCTCSSVKLWKGVIAAGYGNGQIRLYEAATGVLRAQVHAHARWIYALDLAPLSGKLLSGAEDSFVHVWQLGLDPDTGDVEIEHCHSECVTDTQICGARFCDPEGSSFAVTGYDLSEIIRYAQV
ncbi:WD repeat-containing protein 54 isoform X2 [Alligator mississippiensis]|uniref:WD repeat-containing protein 54 isoform X2 n=1 Tax=Alligator mississippiensis TaxID=8496 RepID=UPI002877D326|nr:WD repeat-containing protein 54 isoform X2 [Alligator mississippiensis]